VPLDVRMATGGGRQLAAQHSHSLENWYASIPGIKVLAAGTVQDAHDMLLAALQERDPVVIFEHQVMYALEGELDEAPPLAADVWRAAIRRPGRDLSIVTFGGTLPKALTAASELEAAGIDAEVIDLRCLRPLDLDTVLASVRRTKRLLATDETWLTGGLAGEIVARVAEQAFFDLDAAPVRVCSAEVPVPYAAHLERAVLPKTEDIVRAAKRLVGHV
jgi:pyruvate dehydrogenase E1 component beta subunit